MAIYCLEIYSRPENTRQPVLANKEMISAADDAIAIPKAEQLFLAHEAPSVTGFILKTLGARLSDERLVHNYVKASDGFNGAVAQVRREAAALAPATAAMRIETIGEEVTRVPECIGFSS